MAGDERQLRHELLDASRGLPPRTSFWDRDQALASYFSGQGSQNIWLMRWAVQALRGRKGTRPGYSGGDLALSQAVYAYQLGPQAVGLPADTTTINPASEPTPIPLRPGFGGTEFLSTIYWAWHMMSHLALCRCKDPQVAGWARRWSILNWVLFRAITAPDGSLLLFGQRSAGHNPKPREVDWFYALASDGDVKRAERWCKEAGAGLRQSWEFEIGNELRPEMRETWKESLALLPSSPGSFSVASLEILPALLPLRVPTEIVRTSEGLAVVHAATCNANTPPILAGVHAGGVLSLFPPSGGHRIRQRFDHATARIEGNEIVYQSSLYTGGEEMRMALPGGELIYHLRLGSSKGGAASSPAPAPPLVPPASEPGPSPVPSPAPAPTTAPLSRAASLLSGLQLAAKDRGRRDAIVAALRAGEDPEPFIPIIKGWFRADSPQPQAVQWREALSLLEGEKAQ